MTDLRRNIVTADLQLPGEELAAAGIKGEDSARHFELENLREYP